MSSDPERAGVKRFPGMCPHRDAVRLGHLSYVGNPERVVEKDTRIDEDGIDTIEHA
ncbi:hypothetical protein AB9M10_03335 [Rhodococcus erythropolis]